MRTRSDIIREADEAFNVEGVHKLKAFHSLKNNVYKMIDFFDDNDLWDVIVLCDNENVTYFCLYVLFFIAVDGCCDEIKEPQKYYDFSCDWARKNLSHYLESEQKGMINDVFEKMLEDFSKILKESLMNDEEDE